MINLARGLGMQTGSLTTWTQLQGDCCTADDLVCSNQRVTDIYWKAKGLNGVINGTAIPSTVTYLSLSENLITGNIPNHLPSGLVYLFLDGNRMSGDLPAFPSTLRFMELGYPANPGNHFTGSLRLNRPDQLYINDNWITDVIFQDSTGLSECDLSNNPLLGNPYIAGLNMCTKNGLYSAIVLPNTKTTTKITTTTKAETSSSFASSTDTPSFFTISPTSSDELTIEAILTSIIDVVPTKTVFTSILTSEYSEAILDRSSSIGAAEVF